MCVCVKYVWMGMCQHKLTEHALSIIVSVCEFRGFFLSIWPRVFRPMMLFYCIFAQPFLSSRISCWCLFFFRRSTSTRTASDSTTIRLATLYLRRWCLRQRPIQSRSVRNGQPITAISGFAVCRRHRIRIGPTRSERYWRIIRRQTPSPTRTRRAVSIPTGRSSSVHTRSSSWRLVQHHHHAAEI